MGKVIVLALSEGPITSLATPDVEVAFISPEEQSNEEFEANLALIQSPEWQAAFGEQHIEHVLGAIDNGGYGYHPDPVPDIEFSVRDVAPQF